ncbi:secretion protein HlyD, partial [Cronobacter malonaticus]|nr:secretion protein HlyD [Cronobacter malonaticus]
MNKKRVALLALVVVIIVAAIAGWRWYAARHTPLT